MGLLDALNSRDGIFALGLLDAASPKPVRTSIGGGLLAALSGAQRWQQEQDDRATAADERKQRGLFQGLQMQQMQQSMAQQQEAAMERKAAQEAAQQAAQRRGGFLDSLNPNAGPAMPFNPAAALAAGIRPEEAKMLGPQEQESLFGKINPGDFTPDSLARFAATRDFTQLRKAEAPEKAPEALRTLELIYGKGSPQYLQAAQQLAAKMTTHQPGVSVTYGAPVAGVDGGGNPIYFQPSKDGGAPSILKGVAPPTKDLPSGMAEKFAQNSVTLGKIDQALGLVRKNPAALGAQNYLPDAVVQRVDPGGTEVRALVADIGGQKIHDRSGAAVTVAESARLKPYIPAATDTPQVAAQKLELFRQEYAAMQRALASGASIRQAAQGGGTGGTPADVDDLVRKYTGGR